MYGSGGHMPGRDGGGDGRGGMGDMRGGMGGMGPGSMGLGGVGLGMGLGGGMGNLGMGGGMMNTGSSSGISPEILAQLGIDGPVSTQVFVANVSRKTNGMRYVFWRMTLSILKDKDLRPWYGLFRYSVFLSVVWLLVHVSVKLHGHFVQHDFSAEN